MATTNEYLQQLQNDKATLVNNLNEQGIKANDDETFTTLCPKVGLLKNEKFKATLEGKLTPIRVPPNVSGSFTPKWYLTLDKLDILNGSFGTMSVYGTTGFFDGFLGSEINMTNFKINPTDVKYLFAGCRGLITLNMLGIDLGRLNDISGMFNNNVNLTNITFGYDYGKGFSQTSQANYRSYTLDFNQSKLLTHDSLMDIGNKLYDLNLTYDVANGGTLKTQQVIIGPDNIAKLSIEEITIFTSKGFNVL